ncbi:hypothetical protein AJ88_03920 [Mesorhizobium amorphae CCBAU 01583]|nr:hypothetical protein AJ88_03920 [Mesorhizobium amorphae CCBAU 01583]
MLVKDQTDARENGIYIASTGLWQRARDLDSNRDLTKGTRVSVTDGTAGGSREYYVSTSNPITVGTTNLNFSETPGSLLGSGLPNPPVANTFLQRNPGNTAYVAKTVAETRDALDTAPYVATRTALKALDTTKDTTAILTETQRAGIFVWTAGDLSALVALDPGEALWIKADAIATTAGAWVRQTDQPYDPLWFGCTIDGVASDTAFGRFLDVLIATGNPGRLPTGAITLAAKVTKNVGAASLILRGRGPDVSILRWTAADGGIDLTTTHVGAFVQWSRQVEMCDFSIKTTQASGGTASSTRSTPRPAPSAQSLGTTRTSGSSAKTRMQILGRGYRSHRLLGRDNRTLLGEGH